MIYELYFHPLALKEWKKLSKELQEQFKKQLERRLENPHVISAKLSARLKDCYKIKLHQAGYRLVYQIDKGMRRLLWCGKDRKAKTLLRFFRDFGKERCDKLQFVCSDMWKPYLKVIKKKCVNALNILDRFHIAKKLNEAVDQVRRDEVKELKDAGNDNMLEKSKYILLKRPENLSDKQSGRLEELIKINLSSIKAYLLKEMKWTRPIYQTASIFCAIIKCT